MSGGIYSSFKAVEIMIYCRKQSFDDSLMFAKCIVNHQFLISILPAGLLIRQEGKMLTKQHFQSAF